MSGALPEILRDVVARRVLERRAAAEYAEVLIDLQTAHAMVSVYDGLNDRNRARLLEIADGDVARLGMLCWRIIGRAT